eukprot:SAG25_NODE_59_length_18387_cov_33.379770_12_plen_170_part_00
MLRLHPAHDLTPPLHLRLTVPHALSCTPLSQHGAELSLQHGAHRRNRRRHRRRCPLKALEPALAVPSARAGGSCGGIRYRHPLLPIMRVGGTSSDASPPRCVAARSRHRGSCACSTGRSGGSPGTWIPGKRRRTSCRSAVVQQEAVASNRVPATAATGTSSKHVHQRPK